MQDPDLLDVALHLPAAAPPLGVPWHSLRMACLGGGWFKAVYSLELFVTPSLVSTLVKPSFQTRTEYMTQQQFKEKTGLLNPISGCLYSSTILLALASRIPRLSTQRSCTVMPQFPLAVCVVRARAIVENVRRLVRVGDLTACYR